MSEIDSPAKRMFRAMEKTYKGLEIGRKAIDSFDRVKESAENFKAVRQHASDIVDMLADEYDPLEDFDPDEYEEEDWEDEEEIEAEGYEPG